MVKTNVNASTTIKKRGRKKVQVAPDPAKGVFVPLRQVPDWVEDPIGECLQHTNDVITAQIAKRQRRACRKQEVEAAAAAVAPKIIDMAPSRGGGITRLDLLFKMI